MPLSSWGANHEQQTRSRNHGDEPSVFRRLCSGRSAGALLPNCGARFRFAHEWCPECWSLELKWEKVSGKGKVGNFSVVHQAPYEAFAEVTPYVLALIELDEGVRIMSNVVGCDPEVVHVGMPVQVVFERRLDVTLPMFGPADGYKDI